MGIRYGSKESIELCDLIGYIMAQQSILTSYDMALLDGNYPNHNPNAVVQSAFFSEHISEQYRDDIAAHLRNSQLLTIAPTGSLSSMLGVSGGIEPIYANYYMRKTESLHGRDEYYKVYTPIVKEYMETHGIKDDKDLPDFFVTAQTLNYEERIDMQAIWQKHIDASISSTVNVPNEFTVEDTEKLYMRAWEEGLKGVTIFRDGCARIPILSTDNKTEETKETETNKEVQSNKLERGMIIKVDNNTVGKERHLTTGCGSLHCAAFFEPDTGELLEVYLSKGSSGGCQSNLAAVSRLMSLSARAGVDVYTIVDQLKSCMSCPSYAVRAATKRDTSIGNCCPSAVGNALIDMYKEMQSEIDEDVSYENKKSVYVKKSDTKQNKKEVKTPKAQCPQCGEELIFEGGCNVCKSCGWSKCD